MKKKKNLDQLAVVSAVSYLGVSSDTCDELFKDERQERRRRRQLAGLGWLVGHSPLTRLPIS